MKLLTALVVATALMAPMAHAEDPAGTVLCGVSSPVRSMAESAAAQDNLITATFAGAVGLVGGIVKTAVNSVEAVLGGPALTCKSTTYIVGG